MSTTKSEGWKGGKRDRHTSRQQPMDPTLVDQLCIACSRLVVDSGSRLTCMTQAAYTVLFERSVWTASLGIYGTPFTPTDESIDPETHRQTRNDKPVKLRFVFLRRSVFSIHQNISSWGYAFDVSIEVQFCLPFVSAPRLNHAFRASNEIPRNLFLVCGPILTE